MAIQPQTYQVRKLDPSEYALWDHFVYSTPSGTLFHTALWAELIHRTFNRPFEIQSVFRKDEMVGGILFFPQKSLGFSVISYPPVTAYQGILVRQPITPKLSTAITEYHEICGMLINRLKADYHFIQIPLSPGIVDARPFQWAGFYAEPFYTYSIPITEPEKLKEQFSKNLRTYLNSPLQNEFVIKSSDDAKPLINYVAMSYRHHGSRPPVSEQLLLRHLSSTLQSGVGRLLYLYHQGIMAAGLFILYNEHTVYAYFSGMDEKSRESQYIKFLTMSVLETPEFIGKKFDFLGANTPGFEPYKRSFGGELQLYFKVTYHRNRFVQVLSFLRKQQHLLQRKS
jgi:hypothetical protein